MTYWHEYNPWKDEIIYITPREAASLCGYSWPADETLEHWAQYGDKLDAYILPQPSGLHSIGVRFGPEGSEYLSPYPDYAKVDEFLAVRGKR